MRAEVQMMLLVLAVPAQYYLASVSSNDRSYYTKRLVGNIQNWYSSYFNLTTWKWWLDSLMLDALEIEEGFCPAVEVEKFRSGDENFAKSTIPRTPRPPHVRYRIGQVIRHRQWGYRGVIVGWDPVAKAPKEWLDHMHPADKPHWRKKANYLVLVDTRDRLTPQSTYVAEENIEILTNRKIIHPKVGDHFEEFDNSRYIPRPWLRKVYPDD
ncbi:uncharacterized protein TRIADDRAFT_56958 [Trichoplax adhaerens]|uniref:Hemimethylated DNA-binding domain-containing protein n=1 Tax=Trichoplax adhaerens TaxID=10228 RepID=B3RX14_TRIAD|nr:hypothetical protein TRIADDRAFT_56958 [Trichoplax adhaerens]EDV24793.1 hypothetical protein TRIADDRAFT_56958 [Trichoplax adhaerens]|eukprot:XP_002112683.1 hypothetical protein TRIADDRAFT_56958 [Trichoplax adhaerens]